MEKELLNIKQSADFLGISESYFRNVISDSIKKYDSLKEKKVIIANKTFFNVEDLLKVKLERDK